MKRLLVWMLLLVLLCGCAAPEQSEDLSLTEEPLVLASLALECSAPPGSGGDFPAAARAFGEALRLALHEEGVTVEKLNVSFSRVDAATVDALESGGVSLGILGIGGALVEKGEVLLALSRSAGEPSCGLLVAGESEYGKQLAWRTKTTPLTAEEWSRARIGAVESDRVLIAAAQQLLYESAGYTMEEYRGYATEEELLTAVSHGEVDAAIMRAENTEEFWALTEMTALHEGAVVLSAAAEQLQSDGAKAALAAALTTAADTEEGKAFLAQYGCGGFAAATEEEIEAMRSLAIWEEME